MVNGGALSFLLAKVDALHIPVEFFPTVMIVLDILAALVYLAKGNVRMSLYWVSAAVLTACITFEF